MRRHWVRVERGPGPSIARLTLHHGLHCVVSTMALNPAWTRVGIDLRSHGASWQRAPQMMSADLWPSDLWPAGQSQPCLLHNGLQGWVGVEISTP
jgi:hypothetical protein